MLAFEKIASTQTKQTKLLCAMTEAISDADQLCDLILNGDTLFDKLQLPLPRLNILGVAEWKLTLPDIKKAYRDISLKVHPDKCTSERANDAFLAVGTAFRTLSDDREREIYINAFGEKLKLKQSAASMSQGWSQTADSSNAAEVATSLGIDADLVAAATSIELDVAIARQERLSAVAYQRASFQKHGEEMVQQMQARRTEHIATKEKERETVQKRAYQRINQPAQPSSEESSSSEESDSSDDDDDAALRNLAALKQRKKKFARQL